MQQLKMLEVHVFTDNKRTLEFTEYITLPVDIPDGIKVVNVIEEVIDSVDIIDMYIRIYYMCEDNLELKI